MHLAQYGFNNPGKFVDPYGLFALPCKSIKTSFSFGASAQNFWVSASASLSLTIQGKECKKCCSEGVNAGKQVIDQTYSLDGEGTGTISASTGQINLEAGKLKISGFLEIRGSVSTGGRINGSLASDWCMGIGLRGKACGEWFLGGQLDVGGFLTVKWGWWTFLEIGFKGTFSLEGSIALCYDCQGPCRKPRDNGCCVKLSVCAEASLSGKLSLVLVSWSGTLWSDRWCETQEL